MTEDRGTLRSVAWQELFPGLALFSAVRMALSFRALLLAAVALVGMVAGWRLCGELLSKTDDPRLRSQIEGNSAWPWEIVDIGPTTPAAGWIGAARSEPLGQPPVEVWPMASPLVQAWRAISYPFEQIFAVDASFAQFVYWLVCALWSLAVWAYFGGAITRIAAVRLGRQENLSWRQLSRFTRQRWPSYFAAPLFPILGAMLCALFLALLGLLMRAGVGLLVAGLVWPVALLLGFMMAFLLIGLFFAWPLMWGAISAEGTDSFGALSHSYSYAYQRPWHYLLYVLVAGAIGVAGWYLVSLFATLILMLTDWGVSWGSGLPRLEAIREGADLDALGNWGGSLVRFWNGCIGRMVPLAYFFSYLWTSSTVIYFLLRRLVDATEMDEVYSPDDQDRRGLPPLKTGPDGVPQVADEAALAGDDNSR